MKRRDSIKNLEFKDNKLKGIENIIYQIGLKRGEESAKKVFQVLALWQEKGLILSFGKNPEWKYHDYILHQDGWFITLDVEMVNFQIKSSYRAAFKHREKYSDVPVIVVSSGVRIDELDKEMQRIFKDKIGEFNKSLKG